MGMKLEGLWCP